MTIPKLIVAIFMNILFLPGAGQIFVKEKKRGYIFSLLVVALLLAATYSFTGYFKEEIASLKMSNDILGMARVIEANLWAKHDLALRGYGFGLAALYILSIFDMVLIYFDRKGRNA